MTKLTGMSAPDAANSRDRETIAGLARGLAVIRAFSTAGGSAMLTEIAGIAALSPAVVRRCLHTLEELGYAGRTGRQFFLRPKVLDLSAAYLDSVNSELLASDYLQEIVAATGHSASLTVLDDLDIVYLAHAGLRRVLRIEASTGTRYPAYCTSTGRVLLAALSDEALKAHLEAAQPKKLTRKTVTDIDQLVALINQARSENYALVEDQLAIGVLSIAVPVRDQKGRVVAAINCSAQSGETSQRALRRFLPLLHETSLRITGAIRFMPGLTTPKATLG